MLWILVAVAVLLLVWGIRERYTDPERKVTRPSLTDAAWRSKIDAAAPIGGDDAKYIQVLQAFYDNVYVPAQTKPKDTDVEAFLNSTDAAVVSDKASLREIIVSSFSIERTTTASAREEKQVKFQPTAAINPKMGVNPLARPEGKYTPADSRTGELSEGVYEPVEQQPEPRRTGEWDDRSTSWSSAQFAGVSTTAKNVL